MRIEKLNENKIKVTLTSNDLNSYDINLQNLHHNSTELHSFLFKIMETIQKETGFNPYNGQVAVEAQSDGTGLSIVVSKIGTFNQHITEKTKGKKKIKARIKDEKASTAEKAPVEDYRCLSVYYFDSFDVMCAAICEMEDSVNAMSMLYKYENKYCYMLDLDELIVTDRAKLFRTVGVFSEFATGRLDGRMMGLHIKEHGKLIAEGEDLVTMARELQKINK